MPELPEVETIKLDLKKCLVGHKISTIDVRNQKSFPQDVDKVRGGVITDVRRLGKVLILDFSNQYSLLIHLKMSGQLIYQGPNLKGKSLENLPDKYTRVVLSLDRGADLFFNDVRKFGWMKIAKTDEIVKYMLAKLGPEPLKDLNLSLFTKILKSSKRPIKLILMDQAKVSGIGNIYANEALWLAAVNPKTPADKLSKKQVIKLLEAVEKVLKRGIKYGGTTERYYTRPNGSKGNYQEHFLVYDQKGKKCPRCHRGSIEKMRMGGRGTYFCPTCQ